MKNIFLIFVIITFFGCTKQSTPDGLPKLVPVTLTIIQDGSPLAQAVVSLVGNVPFVIGGTTDATGSVVVYTHGQYKGAPLGQFKVRVVKTESDFVPPAPPMGTPEFAAYRKEIQRNPPKIYTLVEKRYTQVDTTPLELEITGPLTQTLDVGKAIKETI